MANGAVVIAIDGPVGSGKSTVAMLVARKLGCRYVDSGAVYRAVAWLTEKKNLDLHNADAVAALASEARIEFKDEQATAKAAGSGGTDAGNPQNMPTVIADGSDVTSSIRSLSVAQLSSKLSTIPSVRDAVNIKLRNMAKGGNVVMDGRDIATVVLPEADLKIFLNASIEVRALRRKKDLEAAGEKVEHEHLIGEIKERDDRDTNRTIAPLRQDENAVVIDTDHLSIEQVVSRIIELIGKLPVCDP